MKQPLKLGTIWTASARIQRINRETGRWQTLSKCSDTPSAIKAEVAKLVRAGHPVNTLWVVGAASDRKMVIDL